MSKAFSANIHDPNHTVDEYDLYFNGDILSGNGEHKFSANIHDPNHTAEEYDIYFNGELIESGGEGWTDGVPYTDIEIVNNEYINISSGAFTKYNGWNRTGYIPCHGASRISIPKLSDTGSPYNAFYDKNHEFIRQISIPVGEGYAEIEVPTDAYFFAMSDEAQRLTYILNRGVIPHA